MKFPSQLDTPYAVSQVLNQEPGKMRAKDLRELVVTKGSTPKAAATRQMKVKLVLALRFHVFDFRGECKRVLRAIE